MIEMIIVTVLLGLLAAVGSGLLFDSFTTTQIVDSKQAVAAQTRYALERVEREIRELKYGSTATAYCFISKTPTQLAFYKTPIGKEVGIACTTNADATNADIVNVDISAGNLRLGSTATNDNSTPVLISNVSTFSLAYLDSNGCATTLITNTPGTDPGCVTTGGVRFVQIDLTVLDSNTGQTIAQSTRIALRNSV